MTNVAKGMKRAWYLDHRIATKLQEDTGKLIPFNPTLLSKGDFVDVLVGVNVSPVPPFSRGNVNIDFTIKEVVVLQRASPVSNTIGCNEY